MPRDLTGRVIVITGASAGIGAATAAACAAAGMRVVIGARRLEVLQEVEHRITSTGGQAVAARCDVDRDDDVARLVQLALDRFGRLDAVYANAGYGRCVSVLDMPDADAHAMFETNFYGTLRLVRAAVPVMLRNNPPGGHVLICSSAASELGLPMYGVYSATKAAQDSVAGAMRAELELHNIHVSTVHPIGTRTEFFEVASPEPGSPMLNTPAAMMQSPEHVARAIVRCLRRPRPEVWPSALARFGLAMCTAFPRLGAFVARRIYRNAMRC